MGRSGSSYKRESFQRLGARNRTPCCRALGFEALEDRRLLAAGTLHGSVSSPNVNIPDNGGNVSMSIALSGAPASAVITNVSVHYTVAHPNVGDLRAYLTAFYGDTWHDHLWLWNRAGGGQDSIDETESGLSTWDGVSPNQTWYLVARDEAAGATGYIDSFEIWVDYDTVSPIVDGRLAYHSYTGYGIDGELHVWDFSSNQAYTRAEQAVNARVRYAMNPQISGNGRYLVLMGVDRQLPKAWPNLDVFIYDFRNDTVTNLSEALISAGFLTADWIDEDPSFDPTSLTIAFKRRSDGSSDLWSMRLDGTATTPIALTRLTNSPSVEESGPKYSPDGQTIVCWIGAGASSSIGTIPAAGGAVTPVVNNENKQDYYPSYWQSNRIIYTSWDTAGSGDDDIKIFDLPVGPDAFGMAGFHSAADDSDPFAITPDLLGFSSTNASADGKWRLWHGNPTTGAAQLFPFHTANKHDLGGVYTPHVVKYVPGPERPELPGDYDFDNVVDAADYVVWRDLLGSTVDLRADGSGPTSGVPDGVVDQYDYDFWKANFGNVLSTGGEALLAPIASTARALTIQLPALKEDNLAAGFAAFTSQPPDVSKRPLAELQADRRLLVLRPPHSMPTSLGVRPFVAADGIRAPRSDRNAPPFDTLIDWLASPRTAGLSAAAVDSPLVDEGDAEDVDSTEAYDVAFDLLGSDEHFSAF